MKLKELQAMGRDEVYEHFTKDRINADSPIERNPRHFPIGSRAYMWTNEALVTLKDELHLDLEGRDMLLVSASGDPFATFATLGVGGQVGFDTSHRAILWDEVKLAAIQALGYRDFRRFTRLEGEEGERRDYWGKISPHVSQYARDVVGTLFSRHENLQGIINSGKLFRGRSCTGYFPESNIYADDKREYEKAKSHLKDNPPVLIPGDLNAALNAVDDKVGAFYASNIIDHFQNDRGEIEHSEPAIGGFLRRVDEKLRDDALMIFQFEWSQEAKQIAKKVLSDMGYDFESATNSSGRGYGQLAIARRK